MSRFNVLLHRCAALATLWWMTMAAQGQSIDPAEAILALHRPFQLQLPVRTAAGEGATATMQRLAQCIEADFQNGSTLLFSDQMRVSLRGGPRPGWQTLVFEHPHVVQDPVLFAHVVLRCPARFEREFVLRATEPSSAPEPVSSVAAASTETPAMALRAAGTGHPATTQHARAQPAAPAARPSQRGRSTAPPATDPLHDEIERLRAALAQAQLRPAANPSLSSTSALNESTSPQTRIPAIGAALVSAPIDPPDDPTQWRPGLLMTAAALAAALPFMRWWRRRCRLPRLQSMDIAHPLVAPFGPSASDPLPSRHTSPPVRVILEEQPEPVDLIPATPVQAGVASLADRDAAKFTHQIEGLVSDGYAHAALGLLEKTLSTAPTRNPWLMLQLLDLYEQQREHGQAARLIGELQTLYRVQIPTVGGVSCKGKCLTEVPLLMQEIERAWPTDEMADLLEDLIHRSQGPTWDLATFQDLLLLHSIVVDRDTTDPEPRTTSAQQTFEPVLEWTIEEP